VHGCLRVDVGGDVTVAAAAAADVDDDDDDDCDDNNNDKNNSDKNNHSDDVVCNWHKLKSKHMPLHTTTYMGCLPRCPTTVTTLLPVTLLVVTLLHVTVDHTPSFVATMMMMIYSTKTYYKK
jgi:hypothetical protein